MNPFLACALGLALVAPAGAVVYSESIDGELSGIHTSPTPLTLDVGSNSLLGDLAGGGTDVDLLSLVVPTGAELVAIRLAAFSGGGAGSFFGMQPGSILSSPPSSTFPDAIGYVLISGGLVGTDVLDEVVFGPPFNFQQPLPAGEYAVWLNETGAASSYELNFEVAAIPEPSLPAVLGLSALVLLPRRKR